MLQSWMGSWACLMVGDGCSDNGSTAQMAKWLQAPVILVLDCWTMARSAGAMVKGYADFDPELCLGGLLLNKVGGDAHKHWLQDAIRAAGVSRPVLGGIPRVSISTWTSACCAGIWTGVHACCHGTSWSREPKAWGASLPQQIHELPGWSPMQRLGTSSICPMFNGSTDLPHHCTSHRVPHDCCLCRLCRQATNGQRASA